MSTQIQNGNPDKDWWRGAVIYQVYPRSYQDSNGDGIGDLPGLTQRLPYIAELGVDAVWISPFFQSPMKDYGYDVSDYRAVDPIFGDLAAFDEMISTAHGLGLKIMIDLVLSHSSDQHEWFAESRQSKDNSRADWYVWADAKLDGSPPNNWLSIFGGPAWTWDTSRRQYYMHNFLSAQPDFNFHNLDVQNALLDVARFWLDRGVDGFRLDTINFYFCDKQLRDNPGLPLEERNSTIAPEVNPYNFQNHLHDKNQSENLVFLERLRALMDEYPAVAAVGEIGDAQYGMQLLADYTEGDARMHMCYSFEFLSGPAPDAARVQAVLAEFADKAPDSWSCWAYSNHDVVRHATRWAADSTDPQAYLRMVTALVLSMQGSVCLYQGEELALPEADIKFEDLQDPYGITFWPEFKGRDGCRTPMPWQQNKANAGFGDAKPWLPVPETHQALSVDQQLGQRDSMLHYYRGILALRRQHPALVSGALQGLMTDGNVLSFERELDGQRLLCVFNFGGQAVSVSLPDTGAASIAGTDQPATDSGLFNRASLEGDTLTLQGLAACWLQL